MTYYLGDFMAIMIDNTTIIMITMITNRELQHVTSQFSIERTRKSDSGRSSSYSSSLSSSGSSLSSSACSGADKDAFPAGS